MRIRVFVLVLATIVMSGLLVTATTAATAPSLTPMEQLGKSIFFDASLSGDQPQACAACHAPEAGWTGPDSSTNADGAVYEGSIAGAFGNRKPPSSAYATYAPILHVDKKGVFVGGNFWDGRATGEKLGNPAADQAQGPFLNPKEQACPDASYVVQRVATGTYPVSFEDVWGWDPATVDDVYKAYDQIALSIAAYEASFESNAFTSKFDAWRAGTAHLTQEEVKGFSLFMGKGKCAKCHTATGQGGTPALFTDFTYDNLGIPKNPENPVYDYDPGFIDLGLGGYLATRTDYAAYAEANLGKFKVPTLRNVATGTLSGLEKAYGHNGYFKSLEEIVHFYNTRDVEQWDDPEVAQNINTAELGNLGLTAAEEAAIVAFLKTLSDGYMP